MKLETIIHHLVLKLKPDHSRTLVFDCPMGSSIPIFSYLLMTSSGEIGRAHV